MGMPARIGSIGIRVGVCYLLSVDKVRMLEKGYATRISYKKDKQKTCQKLFPYPFKTPHQKSYAINLKER